MFRLPARAASQRVSVWRKLRKYGALVWKNSAYILPHTPGNMEKFQWLLTEIREYRGDGSVVRAERIEGVSNKEVLASFNKFRAREYERLIRDLRLYLRSAAKRSKAHRRGALARLNRRLAEIAANDVFGCSKRGEAGALIKELEAQALAEEPRGRVRGDTLRGFRRRVWMTRPRPEVDRAASAWLIKNFIDAKARFIFSSDPHAHRGALRFDMFEGEFSHVGDQCTFETLLKRFSLIDKRLLVIAQLVHDADLQDSKFARPEGKAIDLILKGWAQMDWSDEEILRRGFDLFDALYLTLGR